MRLAISGMGDALATYFEAKACVDSEADTCAGGKATSAALALARLCFDTLMADGVKAKVALEAGCSTPAVEHVIEANTLLSGIGFESCGLAAAHAVHNGMTQLPETHAMLHGEKVAFGTLVQLVLENAPTETFEQVMGFCLEVDLPVTLGDLGVEDISRERIMAVAEAACAPRTPWGTSRLRSRPTWCATRSSPPTHWGAITAWRSSRNGSFTLRAPLRHRLAGREGLWSESFQTFWVDMHFPRNAKADGSAQLATGITLRGHVRTLFDI